MITSEIISYIRSQLASGVSQESLRSSLLARGWMSQDVEEAFRASSVSAPPLPTPQTAYIPKKGWTIGRVLLWIFIIGFIGALIAAVGLGYFIYSNIANVPSTFCTGVTPTEQAKCQETFRHFIGDLMKNATTNTNNLKENKSTEPAVLATDSNRPVSEWSLEAHDENNKRISLCQSNNQYCIDAIETAIGANKISGQMIGQDKGKQVTQFNNAISGAEERYLINNEGAEEYCQNLKEGGHDDWVLPSIQALKAARATFEASMTNAKPSDYYNYSPFYNHDLNMFHFTNYWSSSKDGRSGLNINFETGEVGNISSGNARSVRCGR